MLQKRKHFSLGVVFTTDEVKVAVNKCGEFHIIAEGLFTLVTKGRDK
jgi:hypothetical protein